MKRHESPLVDVSWLTRHPTEPRSSHWQHAHHTIVDGLMALKSPGEAVLVHAPSTRPSDAPWDPDWDYENAPFAQVDVTSGFALRTIFGSNQFLASRFKIEAPSIEAMRRLGFAMPRDIDPSDPTSFAWDHYFLREDPPSAQSVKLLSRVILVGLRDCFGVDDPSALMVSQWLRSQDE